MDLNNSEWSFSPMPGHQIRVTLATKGTLFVPGNYVTEVVLTNCRATELANTLMVLEAMYEQSTDPSAPESDVIILENA